MQRNFTDAPLDEAAYPFSTGVLIQRRSDGTLETNVPHLVVEHSPNGFEFGYGGSGPADLALNIVENALRLMGYDSRKVVTCWDNNLCFSRAYELHQDFKWKFIAPLPREGGFIPFETIKEWIERAS